MFKWFSVLLLAAAFLSTYRYAYCEGFERTSFWFVHPALSDQEIEKQIATFVQSGVNGVIIGGGGHHYLHNDLPNLENQIAITRKIVKRCHAKGIKVCEHHSSVLTGNTDFAKQHSQWLMKDFSLDGSSSIIPEYQTQAFCPNNPEFRSHYWQLLSKYIESTDVDAVMSDDASFYKGCSCKTCADRWYAETGGDIKKAYTESQVIGSAQWRQWNAIHNRWMIEYWQWLTKKIRTEFPKVSILGLSISIASPWTPQVTHSTPESVINSADCVVWEIYNPSDFYSWRRISAEAAAFSDVAGYHDIRVCALPYADIAAKRDVFDIEEEYFMWGLAKSHGMQFTLSRVFLTGLEQDSPRRNYWLFEKSNVAFLESTEPYAPVGIVFSAVCRDNDPSWEYFHVVPYIGWGNACSENGILWQAITDETLETGIPKHIKTLVLPDVFSMSDKGYAVIEKFVSSGGTLIATHLSGLYEEAGNKCREDRKTRLEALFGVNFHPENGLKIPDTPTHTAKVSRINAEHRNSPFEMYLHHYKKGKVLYIPGVFESAIAQNYMNEGEEYRPIAAPQLSADIARLISEYTPVTPVSVKLPDTGSVLCNLRKQSSNTLHLHMLNVAGSNLAEGSNIPSPSKVVWSKQKWITLNFYKEPKYIEVISLDGKYIRIDNPTKSCRIQTPQRYQLVIIKE